MPSFLEDAARGTLPSVSWIDPAFANFNPFGFRQTMTTRPPTSATARTLFWPSTTRWRRARSGTRSLLVIFYDEHGGFFDHVPPPEADDDDPEMFGRYGVRVPAMIVSPWVEPRSVSAHALRSHLDHQDDPAALLRRRPQTPRSSRAPVRLAQNRPSALPGNTRRARQQPGRTSDTRRAPPRASPPRADRRRRGPGGSRRRGNHEPDPQPPTDWQRHIAAATHLLRSRGHPTGRT